MRYPKEKNPEAADEDADIVLEEEPGSVSGLLAKAEAQYHQGAFEHSLKFYYRLVMKYLNDWVLDINSIIQIAKRFDSLNVKIPPTNDHFKRHSVTYE